MRKWISKHRIATAIFGFALALSIGAVAAWLVQSSGSGYAKAGSLQPVTFQNMSATTPAELFPGQTGDGHVKLLNPNAGTLNVVSVVRNTGLGISVDKVGCSAADIVVNNKTGLSIPLPAGVGTEIRIPGLVTLSASAPTECQGALWTIPLTVTAST